MQSLRIHYLSLVVVTVLFAVVGNARSVFAIPPGITLLPPRSTSSYTILDNLVTNHVPVRSELIECEMPEFNFGIIKGGQPILCTFPLKNISNKLVHLHVKPGCACSRTYRSPIMLPGQTVFINIHMLTNKGSGRITKPITVFATGIRIPKTVATALRTGTDWWHGLSRRQQLGLFCIKGALLGRKFS